MDDLLKETVESTMNVYKTAFAEGFKEGYRKAHLEFKELLKEREELRDAR